MAGMDRNRWPECVGIRRLVTNQGIIGIEIKARQLTATDWRPMRELADRMGKEWLTGLVVYRGSRLHQVSDPNIWAVPWRRLFT
jgi:hypothetical protein